MAPIIQYILTWTKFEINIGNIESGKRKMLNRAREAKAVSGLNTFFSSIKTKQANVVSATFDLFWFCVFFLYIQFMISHSILFPATIKIENVWKE